MMDDTLPVRYIKEHLQKGLDRIFEKQREINTDRLNQGGSTLRNGQSRASMLKEALGHPDYIISTSDNGVAATVNYPIQIRFLDMRHLGNWKIYNRQVWGILYRQTIKDIKYEFGDWARQNFGMSLEEALAQTTRQFLAGSARR